MWATEKNKTWDIVLEREKARTEGERDERKIKNNKRQGMSNQQRRELKRRLQLPSWAAEIKGKKSLRQQSAATRASFLTWPAREPCGPVSINPRWFTGNRAAGSSVLNPHHPSSEPPAARPSPWSFHTLVLNFKWFQLGSIYSTDYSTHQHMLKDSPVSSRTRQSVSHEDILLQWQTWWGLVL